MKFGLRRQVIVLGLLSAIGPFAIDMYLPAFPSISRDLGGGDAAQLSLMSFLVAVSIGQLIYGPLSDMVGRRPPLYVGLALFSISAIGCSLATTSEALTGFRFLQGIGACATMVITRAVVRDLHEGAEATRLMSMLMLVLSVSPIIAPTTGGWLVQTVGWRAIFWVIAGLGAMGLALVGFGMPETHAPERRISAKARTVAGHYAGLMRNTRFLALVGMGGLSQCVFFAFLAVGSFLLIQTYGLSPSQFSIVFALCAGSFILAAQFNGMLVKRFGGAQLLRAVVAALAAFAVTLLIICLARADTLWLMCGLTFAMCACQGIIIPTAAVLALEDHSAISGTASALMGSLQLIACSAVIAAVSRFPAASAVPMAVAIAVCATAAFACSVGVFGLGRAPRTAPAA